MISNIFTQSIRTSFFLFLTASWVHGFEPIKFLEINDVHIQDQPSTLYPLKVIQKMEEEHASFVLVAGDVATEGKEDELLLAKGVFDKLTIPYYIERGNHDGDETYMKV